MTLHTVTVRVNKELKEKMSKIKINWSDYIRKAIQQKIILEERRKAAEKLLESLKTGKHAVPKGFINETIRRTRETR